MTLKPEAAVAGMYNVSGTVTMWGSTDPIKDFKAKVEQNGAAMEIILSDDSGSVLTGTYRITSYNVCYTKLLRY